MGIERKYWKLFVRYLAGECSEREEAEVRALIAVDEEKGRLFDDLRRIWVDAEGRADELDAEKAWTDLDRRLQHGARITRLARSRPPAANRRRSRRARTPHSAFLAAAVFVAVIVGTIVAVDLTVDLDQPVQEPDFQIFATQKGERATVHLADGSRVLMNADSRLTVPADFGDGERSVQFAGQGYFSVERDDARSFVVHTELADVQVLGTEFDVHAYPESRQMQVVVATGEVSVRSNQREDAEQIILKPRDLGLVLQAGGQLVRRNIDVDRYLAWREGHLVFENAAFEEVAAELERWYDLRVELERPSASADGLTAHFREEPVDDVLNVISTALNLNYRRQGKEITFYPAH